MSHNFKISDTKLLNWVHNRKVTINWLDSTGFVYASLVRPEDDFTIEAKGLTIRGALQKLYFVERGLK